jgi:hypothetical protein
MPDEYDFDAAIVHHDRVYEITVHHITSSQLQHLVSAMQNQFPALIRLVLDVTLFRDRPPALPDGFLGGSAPSLQVLWLQYIPFPFFPKFLSSATDLVQLSLWNIPHFGCISPEAFVTGLAVLVNLDYLTIVFESRIFLPDQEWQESRSPPPPTRTVLPSLRYFHFLGINGYLEDFVSRINAPILDSIWITFFQVFNRLIFDIPQLTQFMRHTTLFQTLNEAHMIFGFYGVQVESLPPTQTVVEKSLRISCKNLEWDLSYLMPVFTSFFPPIYMVERLYIYPPRYVLSQWQKDIEYVEWLEVFRPFTTVKNLHVCKEFAPCLAFVLQELVGERVTDVLPALESIFLEDNQPSRDAQDFLEDIEEFIAARKLLGLPVTVSHWNGTALKRALFY